MANRPSKRQKFDLHGGAYHDAVPFLDDYSTVQAREGRLLRVGNTYITAPAARSRQPDLESWNQATEWEPHDDPEYALDADDVLYNQMMQGDVMDDNVVEGLPPKKRSRVSKRPHVVWKELYCQTYLDEVIRSSGRGDFRGAEQCPDCVARKSPSPGLPEFRCVQCFIPDLVCGVCCVKRHRNHPFHRIEKWTGDHFIATSLKALGLKIQLNHASLFCSNPVPCHQNMSIIHSNGLHEVAVEYCACDRALPNHIQLLRRGLYPASQISVKTCATFEVLDLLHKMALTTKASTYDFYRALEKLTDNTGMKVPKSRYRALFRMNTQWRYLKMLKWGGRGHDPTGVEGTTPGDLAVLCPSCPRPGINLPEGWEASSAETKFLYTMFVCLDANFRLKNQLVSNYSQDPGLGTGLSYLVPRIPYESYVLSRTKDEDISTCVGLQALAQSHTKYSQGLRYTGVGAASCGRSEMVLALGVGNLQKGERYANMDYVFGSAIRYVLLPLILISYDIACQWFVHLWRRMHEHWPDEIKPSPGTRFIPAIPKLHEPMHEALNHQEFSVNFIPGVGNSDFECPERIWGPHNPLANSTKTMGPGTRHDTLDDHFGFWNWLKYHGQGRTLMTKYKRGIADRNIQAEGHRGLTESLTDDLVASWTAICVAWEGDEFPKTSVNPYHSETSSLTESEVRKELSEEEARRLESGAQVAQETSASGFITLGLELEELQRRVRRLAKETTNKATARQAGGLTEQRNLFRNRLRTWESLFPAYMPGLAHYRSSLENTRSASATPRTLSARPHPEDGEIWLPSKVPAGNRNAVVAPRVADIEERLRMAQLSDSLNTIRQVLKMKTRMIYYKNRNIRGQRDGTKSRAVIQRVHDRAKAAADKYRAARQAKMSLSGSGDWEMTYRVLEDKDIRGYQDPDRLREKTGRRGTFEDEQVERGLNTPQEPPREDGIMLDVEERGRRDGTGETRRTLSWIWLTTSLNMEEDGDDLLRVEWAKSRARSLRAYEEILLVKEEMRRVLAFLAWKTDWWMERESWRTAVEKGLAEGLVACARSQAHLQRDLAESFREIWKTPLNSENPVLDSADGAPASHGNPGQNGDDGGGYVSDDDGDDDEAEDEGDIDEDEDEDE